MGGVYDCGGCGIQASNCHSHICGDVEVLQGLLQFGVVHCVEGS